MCHFIYMKINDYGQHFETCWIKGTVLNLTNLFIHWFTKLYSVSFLSWRCLRLSNRSKINQPDDISLHRGQCSEARQSKYGQFSTRPVNHFRDGGQGSPSDNVVPEPNSKWFIEQHVREGLESSGQNPCVIIPMCPVEEVWGNHLTFLRNRLGAPGLLE